VLELQRSYDLPVLLHFEVVAALCVGLCTWMLLRSGSRRVVLARVLLLLFFALLAWNVGRAVALFGLLAIPVGSIAAELAFRSRSPGATTRFERLAVLASCALLLAPVVLQDAYLGSASAWPRRCRSRPNSLSRTTFRDPSSTITTSVAT
jgi:hypothetical protein